jgi:hypothetical protein
LLDSETKQVFAVTRDPRDPAIPIHPRTKHTETSLSFRPTQNNQSIDHQNAGFARTSPDQHKIAFQNINASHVCDIDRSTIKAETWSDPHIFAGCLSQPSNGGSIPSESCQTKYQHGFCARIILINQFPQHTLRDLSAFTCEPGANKSYDAHWIRK